VQVDFGRDIRRDLPMKIFSIPEMITNP